MTNTVYCGIDSNMEIDQETDAAMRLVQAYVERSTLTLDELGKRMGYPEASARKSAWQFVHKTRDPRLSMLRRFAKAVGVEVSTLVRD